MGKSVEVELTFLARELPKEIKGASGTPLTDIYVPDTAGAHPHVRLRQKGDVYEITKKFPITEGDVSVQQEITIPLTQDEFEPLATSSTRRVSKIRYNVAINGYDAEVDVFQDNLEGLVLIDFEFASEADKDAFVAPDVCLKDVTQEEWIAGGMLAGKRYADIEPKLNELGYRRLAA